MIMKFLGSEVKLMPYKNVDERRRVAREGMRKIRGKKKLQEEPSN
jgi:hypothetical protein